MRADVHLPSRTDRFVAPPVSVALADDGASAGGFSKIALLCWLATVFILYSRFFDLALRGLYIPRVAISLMFFSFLVSGRALVFLRSSVGKLVAVFFLWITFTLTFSVWKGGSLPYYVGLIQSMLYFAIAAGVPNTLADFRKSLNALAMSGLLAALMSIPWGADDGGRLILRGGSYGDPNYYAMAVVTVLPFFWQMAVTSQSKFVKAFAVVSMLPIFVVFAKAGSRGAMLAFAVMMLLLFLISPLKTKMALILVSVFGIAIVFVTVPAYLRARYLSVFSLEKVDQGGNTEFERMGGDMGSAEGRKMLLRQSVALTFEHPLVGVGPGNFPVAVYEEAKEQGITRNQWLVTHNSYTQISCETGFPGFILLLAVIIGSFVNIGVVIKGTRPTSENPDPGLCAAARSLLLSLTVVCICVFFLAVGYDFTIYVWVGLSICLRRIYEQRAPLAIADSNILESAPIAPPAPRIAAYRARAVDRAPGAPSAAAPNRRIRFNRFR